MASFRGSFRHTIDGKGRLSLPKPFRRIIGVKQKDGPQPLLVFTKGFNGSVAAYSEEEWPAFERVLRNLPFTEQSSRDFALELAEMTIDVPVDTVGRVLIPAKHMDLGGFEKNGDVLVLGMFDHIELWDPERFEERKRQSAGSFEERAAKFFSAPGPFLGLRGGGGAGFPKSD